jgi:hypothetical protein
MLGPEANTATVSPFQAGGTVHWVVMECDEPLSYPQILGFTTQSRFAIVASLVKEMEIEIKRGDGKVTSYLEMFWHKPTGTWMTVPGVSRFRNA